MKKLRVTILLVLFLSISVEARNKPINDLDPTVILISIDGFRADYLDLYKPKRMLELARNGVRAKWMTPVFPTKTFPNHYSIATGLYADRHGIVANDMYDRKFDAVFKLSKREEVENPRWWKGEPIWVTAEKQGQTSAAFFFPGTETKIGGVYSSYWRKYDGKIENKKRIAALLRWLDLPKDRRPTFLTTYFSTIDDAGHYYSPESRKTRKAVKKIDKLIGRLIRGLKKRRILDRVNLMLVSDHGMTKVDQRDAIILDEMFDPEDAKQVLWASEFVQIFPKKGRASRIYKSIKTQLPRTAKVYRKADIPKRFRYRNNRRISPILVLADPGWRLLRRERYEKIKAEGKLGDLKGSHGYDNFHPSMRSLFIGHGEAFKKAHTAEPFMNIELYNLMCNILNLRPAKNDGKFENVSDLLKKP